MTIYWIKQDTVKSCRFRTCWQNIKSKRSILSFMSQSLLTTCSYLSWFRTVYKGLNVKFLHIKVSNVIIWIPYNTYVIKLTYTAGCYSSIRPWDRPAKCFPFTITFAGRYCHINVNVFKIRTSFICRYPPPPIPLLSIL